MRLHEVNFMYFLVFKDGAEFKNSALNPGFESLKSEARGILLFAKTFPAYSSPLWLSPLCQSNISSFFKHQSPPLLYHAVLFLFIYCMAAFFFLGRACLHLPLHLCSPFGVLLNLITFVYKHGKMHNLMEHSYF